MLETSRDELARLDLKSRQMWSSIITSELDPLHFLYVLMRKWMEGRLKLCLVVTLLPWYFINMLLICKVLLLQVVQQLLSSWGSRFNVLGASLTSELEAHQVRQSSAWMFWWFLMIKFNLWWNFLCLMIELCSTPGWDDLNRLILETSVLSYEIHFLCSRSNHCRVVHRHVSQNMWKLPMPLHWWVVKFHPNNIQAKKKSISWSCILDVFSSRWERRW